MLSITGNRIDGYNYTLPTQKELCVPGGGDYVNKYGIGVVAVDTNDEIAPYLSSPCSRRIPQGWSFVSPFIQGFLSNMAPLSTVIGELGATNGGPIPVWDQKQTRNHVAQMGKWFKKGCIKPNSQLKGYSTNDEMYASNLDLRLVEQQTSASIIVASHLGASMLAGPRFLEGSAEACPSL
ncbi:MAG: hypothetical protein LBD02_03550 [Christensenellaceae bacterium]|nr:hypothetical protein [Christensenellaceae bacterium]